MSAGQGIGSIVGATIGFFTGGPMGALKGAYWGYTAGSVIDPPRGPHTEGPRLNDRAIQISEDGAPLPEVFGTNRLAGNVIWSTGLEEIATTQEAGGGSGGGGATSTTYTYRTDVAVAVCAGPITGIRRIWADAKLIYSADETATFDTLLASAQNADKIRVYVGSEDQYPDALIQSIEGIDSTPAYRGIAYVVFENLELADFGNRLPNFSFEVVKAGTGSELTLLEDYDNGTSETIIKCDMPAPPQARIVTIKDMGYHATQGGYASKIELWTVDNGVRTAVGSIVVYAGTTFSLFYATSWSVTREADDDAVVLLNASGTGHPILLQFNGTSASGHKLTNVAGSLMSGRTWIEPDLIIIPDLDYGVCVYNRTGLSGSMGGYSGFAGAGIDYTGDSTAPYIRLAVPSGSQYLCNTVCDNTYCYVATWASTTNYIHRVLRSELLALTGDNASGAVTWSTYSYPRLAGTRPSYGSVDICEDGALLHYQTGDAVYRCPPGDWPAFDLLGTLSFTDYVHMTSPVSSARQLTPNLYLFASKYISSGYAVYSTGLLTRQSADLQDVCDTLATLAGLDPGDTDFSALAGKSVSGYMLGRPMSMRAALEPLQMAWHWDISDVDGQLIAVPRGGAVVATLAETDIGWSEQASTETLKVVRTNPTELPSEVQLSYSSYENDYQAATQTARSLTASHTLIKQVSLPLVMTSEQAAQLADTLLNIARYSGAHSLEFTTSYRHARLAPGDVVDVTGNGQTWRARIESCELGAPGLHRIQAVPELASLYTSAAGAADATGIGQVLYRNGETVAFLLDCCLLQDLDSGLGCYLSLTSPASGWRGGQLYKSTDEGATWNEASSFTRAQAADYGSATSALPDADCRVWDKSSVLTVRMTRGTLSSATETAVLDGANAALLGADGRWELIQWKTATLVSPGIYSLTDLLRGRRGTEWASALHAVGDDFVVLSADTIKAFSLGSGELGASRLYRSPTVGAALESVTPFAFTYHAERLTPLPAADFQAMVQPSGDIILNWKRRDRVARAWNSASSLPLSESTESWEVDVVVGSTVVQTLTSNSVGLTFSNADQTEFVTGTSVTFRLYQISAVVGRGHAASVTVVAEPNITGITTPPEGSSAQPYVLGAQSLYIGSSLVTASAYETSGARIWTSDATGSTWTKETANLGVYPSALVSSGSRFVATTLLSGDRPYWVTTATSVSGPWTATDLYHYDSSWFITAYTYDNPVYDAASGDFVVIGKSGTSSIPINLRSADGTTWSKEDQTTPRDVTAGEIASLDTLWTGTTWVAVGRQKLPDVVTGYTRYQGKIWLTADLLDWSLSETYADYSELRAVGLFGTTLIAVGSARSAYNATNEGLIARSVDDGATWADVSPTAPIGGGGEFLDIKAISTRLVAVGRAYCAYSDDDGLTWTWSLNPSGITFVGAAGDDATFIVASGTSTTSSGLLAGMWHTTDGETWTQLT